MAFLAGRYLETSLSYVFSEALTSQVWHVIGGLTGAVSGFMALYDAACVCAPEENYANDDASVLCSLVGMS